jgi:hypothetical protein
MSSRPIVILRASYEKDRKAIEVTAVYFLKK